MLDTLEFNKTLKMSWILKYVSNDCKSEWKCLFNFHLSQVGRKLEFFVVIWHQQTPENYMKDDFIQQRIKLWTDSKIIGISLSLKVISVLNIFVGVNKVTATFFGFMFYVLRFI